MASIGILGSLGIPFGILSRSIKLTNEPPAGLKANLKRAFTSFSTDAINDVDSKSKSIIFGLSFFHAVMIERKQYGPLGYNMMYPFGIADLRANHAALYPALPLHAAQCAKAAQVDPKGMLVRLSVRRARRLGAFSRSLYL